MAQRAKAAVMSIASLDKPSIVEKLWGKQPSQGLCCPTPLPMSVRPAAFRNKSAKSDARRIAAL